MDRFFKKTSILALFASLNNLWQRTFRLVRSVFPRPEQRRDLGGSKMEQNSQIQEGGDLHGVQQILIAKVCASENNVADE